MFLDQFLFELSCKNRETQKHGNAENRITEIHTDSDEYSIVLYIICNYNYINKTTVNVSETYC